MKPNTFVYCPVCSSMTQPFSNIHWCRIEKEGMVVREMKKTWDAHIGAWVLADDDPSLLAERRKAEREEREWQRRKAKLEDSFKGYKKSFVNTQREPDVRDTDKYYDAQSNTWRDLEGRSINGPETEEARSSITWNEYLKKRYGERAQYVEETLQAAKERNRPCSRHGLWSCATCQNENSGFQTCEIKRTENSAEAEKAKFTEGEKNERGHELRCTCVECRPEELKFHLDTCHCHGCYKFKTELGFKIWWHPVDWKQVVPPKPWEGVNFQRWPNTFHFLFKWFHESYSWYNSGRYISDEDYRDRILYQKYKPEKKKETDYPKYYGPYSPYGLEGEDWEHGEG